MQKDDALEDGDVISLRQLFTRFRWQILGTWLLVLTEASLLLMFPLMMGMAIDGLLQQMYLGLYLLAIIGISTVLVGSVRRFYDTRLYSRIYRSAAEQIVEHERVRNSDVSVVSARTGMATELVEFLENSFPGIIDCVIGLGGALVMIWFLQAKVFVGCLVATGVVAVIYSVTRQTTYALNKEANDETESAVEILSNGTRVDVAAHFRRVTLWNIRLSDLETVNFSISWLVMIAVLLFAVVVTIQSGVTAQGKVLSILMYVFGYVESVAAIPLFFQQFIRLQEIAHRITSPS